MPDAMNWPGTWREFAEVYSFEDKDCVYTNGQRCMTLHRVGQMVEYYFDRTAAMVDTGYATGTCSECGVEFAGSIMTNEPPDYVKPLERCPRCGARFEEGGDG